MKITQYTQENVGGGQISSRASAAAFGGNTAGLQAQAQAYQSGARALDDVSRVSMEIKTRREASDYAAIMAEKQLELQKAQFDLSQMEFDESSELDAVYAANFDARMSELQERIPSSQRQRFEEDRLRLRTGFVMSGVEEQSKRSALKIKNNWEKTMTSATNMVALNPSNYEAGMELLRAQVETMPGGAEVKEAALISAQQALGSARADAIARSNPQEFLAGAKSGQYNDVPDLDKYVRAAESEIKQKQAEYKTAVRQEMQQRMEAYRSGFPVSPDLIAADERKARAAGLNETADNLAEIRQNLQFYNDVAMTDSRSNVAQYQELIKQTDNASPERISKLKILKDVLEQEQKAFESGEALELYQSRVGANPLPPLNLDDINTLPQQMNSYLAAADSASVYFGRPVAPFTSNQLKELVGKYKDANVSGKQAIAQTMANLLDAKSLAAVGQALEKENVPLALAAIKMQAKTPIAQAAARYIIDGADRPDIVPSNQLREEIYGQLGSAIRDPKAYREVEQAVANAYKGIALEENDLTDVLNPERVQKAISAVFDGGEIIRFGDSSILPYYKDKGTLATEDDVEITLKNSTIPILEKAGIEPPYGINGQPVDIGQKYDSLVFSSVGDGVVRIMDKDSKFIYVDKDGRPYQLNLRDAQKKILKVKQSSVAK